MDQEDLGLLERCEEIRHRLRQRRDVIGRRALGGQAGGTDFENPPRLVHLGAREPVQRGEKTERFGAEHRGPFRNIGSRAVPRLDDAHRGERA